VTLDNPRLGFVCTGQTVNGDPGLEGYYFEYDREIAPEERVRFVSDEHAPRFDIAKAPKLDTANWPQERLLKVERSYAMEYVRSMLPSMVELFGDEEACRLVGRTARLIGLQYYDELASLLDVKDDNAAGFAHLLAALAAAQGERVEVDFGGAGATITQSGWKLMYGVTAGETAFRAWNALWEGALAVHNRDLRLVAEHRGDAIVWRISPRD
jgi:hypothetical protein